MSTSPLKLAKGVWPPTVKASATATSDASASKAAAGHVMSRRGCKLGA